MYVSQLKELLKDAPDDMMVICFDAGAVGFYPSFEHSGLSEFGEACDANGNAIEGDSITMFALFNSEGVVDG